MLALKARRLLMGFHAGHFGGPRIGHAVIVFFGYSGLGQSTSATIPPHVGNISGYASKNQAAEPPMLQPPSARR